MFLDPSQAQKAHSSRTALWLMHSCRQAPFNNLLFFQADLPFESREEKALYFYEAQ